MLKFSVRRVQGNWVEVQVETAGTAPVVGWIHKRYLKRVLQTSELLKALPKQADPKTDLQPGASESKGNSWATDEVMFRKAVAGTMASGQEALDRQYKGKEVNWEIKFLGLSKDGTEVILQGDKGNKRRYRGRRNSPSNHQLGSGSESHSRLATNYSGLPRQMRRGDQEYHPDDIPQCCGQQSFAIHADHSGLGKCSATKVSRRCASILSTARGLKTFSPQFGHASKETLGTV